MFEPGLKYWVKYFSHLQDIIVKVHLALRFLGINDTCYQRCIERESIQYDRPPMELHPPGIRAAERRKQRVLRLRARCDRHCCINTATLLFHAPVPPLRPM